MVPEADLEADDDVDEKGLEFIERMRDAIHALIAETKAGPRDIALALTIFLAEALSVLPSAAERRAEALNVYNALIDTADNLAEFQRPKLH